LLAGCFPGHQDAVKMDERLAPLVQAGVTLTINLMEPDERNREGLLFVDYAERLRILGLAAGREIRTRRYAIKDNFIPTRELMGEILSEIDRELLAGGTVYVHCLGGKGRTATVVGCCLIAQQRETGESVLARLQELTAHAKGYFWPTPRTYEQRVFVRGWLT